MKNGNGPLDRPDLAELISELLTLDDSVHGAGGGDESAKADFETAQIGRQLGGWTLLELLGSGGMASVYRAVRRDNEFEQFGALKLMPSLLPVQLARFDVERQVLADLNHANVARLIDSGVTDGDGWLVMELIEGERIDEYLADHQLELSERIKLITQVGAALAAAHRRLVVHRDVKPGNVMIDSQGSVKLVDFGIAKQLDADVDHTTTGQALMTLRYAAPEQLLGEPVTTQTDVYSLGRLAYEVLAGSVAFGGSGVAVVNEILNTQPTSLASAAKRQQQPYWAQLRGDLGLVVGKAMARSPGDRYANVEELVADLRAWEQRRPIQARGRSKRYLLGQFLRRHWAPVSLGVLTTLSLVAATFYSRVQYQTAEAAREEAETVADFMRGFFYVLDPVTQESATLTYPQVIDLLAARLAEEPIPPLTKAKLWLELATVNGSIDRQPEAAEAARRARALAAISGDATTQRQATQMLANVLEFIDREQAAVLQRELIDSMPDKTRAENISDVIVLNDYALYIVGRGQTDEAVPLLRVARDYFERQGLTRVAEMDTGESQIWMAVNSNLSRALADDEEAKRYAELVVQDCEIVYRPGHSRCLPYLANLALLHNRLGNQQQAGVLMRRAAEGIERLNGADHRSTLAILSNYSLWLAGNGQPDEAVKLQRRVLNERSAKAVDGASQLEVADSWQNLATLLIKQEAWQQASEALAQVAPIYQRELDPSSLRRSYPYLSLMEIELKRDQPQAALAAGELADESLSAVQSSGHWLRDVVALRRAQALRMLGRCVEGMQGIEKANNALASGAPIGARQRFADEAQEFLTIPCEG